MPPFPGAIHFTLKMEAVWLFRTLVSNSINDLEDHNLYTERSEIYWMSKLQ